MNGEPDPLSSMVHPGWSSAGDDPTRSLAPSGGTGGEDATRSLLTPQAGPVADGVAVVVQAGLERPVLVRTARDPADQAALATAARVAAWLDHPAVETIHLAGPGRVVLRRLAGRTLADAALPLETAVEVLARIAGVVATAHARGIVHRDITPRHIVVGDHGEAWLCGWDLAVAVAPAARGRAPAPDAANACAGTPAYVAPESARGDAAAIGQATDVFLLGATLAHLLRGAPPRNGDAAACLAAAAAGTPLILPDDAPAGLVDLVRRCTAMEPAARGDAVSVQRALLAWRDRARAALAAPALRQEAEALCAGSTGSGAVPRLIAAVQTATRALAADPGPRSHEVHRRCAAALVAACLAEGDLTMAATVAVGDRDQEAAVAVAVAAAQRRAARARRTRRAALAAGVALLVVAAGAALAGPLEQRAVLAARRAEADRLRADVPGTPPEAALAAALRAAGLDPDGDRGLVGRTAVAAAASAVATGAAGVAASHLATALDHGGMPSAELRQRVTDLLAAPAREQRRRLDRLGALRREALAGADGAAELAGWWPDAGPILRTAVSDLGRDGEPAVRALVLRAAAAAGGWLDDDAVIARVGDADPMVRRSAVIALVHRQPAGRLRSIARAVAAADPALGPLLRTWADRDDAIRRAAAADPADRELLWVCGFHSEWAASAPADTRDPALLRRLITAARPQNNVGGRARLRELGRRLAELDPGDALAWTAQGQALIMGGDHRPAWEVMRAGHAAAREPHRLLRWYIYAANWVDADAEDRQGRVDLVAALQAGRYTDDADRQEAVECLLDLRERSDLARSHAEELVRRDPFRADLRLLAARAAAADGDHRAAAGMAAEICDRWPNLVEGYQIRARALIALGQTGDALREARLAVARQPRLGANLLVHAEALAAAGHGAAAVARARSALAMLPGNQGVALVGLRAALRHGFPGDAEVFLRAWIRGGEGGERSATLRLARLALEHGVPGEALALAARDPAATDRILAIVLRADPDLRRTGWPGMAPAQLARLLAEDAALCLRLDPARPDLARALAADAAHHDPSVPGLDLIAAAAEGRTATAARLAATITDGPVAGLAAALRTARADRPLSPDPNHRRPLLDLRLTARERADLQALVPWPVPAIHEPDAGAPRRFADLGLATAPEWDWPPQPLAEWLAAGGDPQP
jgi:hypothetical protein